MYIDKFDTLDESLQEALSMSLGHWAPGIEIISIRVTKPKIPTAILKSYESRETERTKLLLAIEEQKVKEKKAETIKKESMIRAQTEAEVSRIQMEVKQAEKEVSNIQNQIELEKKKAETDAKYYKETKEIEANLLKLTPEYLKYSLILGITNNTKIYFGESIPKFIGDNMLLLDQIDRVVDTPAEAKVAQ